eukprot:6725975-Prymnesium_polylepis.1
MGRFRFSLRVMKRKGAEGYTEAPSALNLNVVVSRRLWAHAGHFVMSFFFPIQSFAALQRSFFWQAVHIMWLPRLGTYRTLPE